ncbi:hypothetical protein L249_3907 [Ophiocordyceps polyrhachis-furcata BCC 54312]|uniref:phosphatidylinositol-3,4,5-trisphosphate 3-phosphatase n=1 Tax=Ophiocordyceps polyrhachis-furcata BCC 54312 TaxID=1330021 RepID=A0A367L576_9HYPO|nr:hypothetical protein L249_3907 [Ophiocordyceps polyrhachis-furcata BCC 54312]
MASILRQIVAGPRSRHPEAGLDLCYVTDFIVTYPQRAYRNPLDQLVSFLDSKHGHDWAIWEFRAEGTGYPDDAVYGRIRHYPWPDHHPPPFGLVPLIMASMRNWLGGGSLDGSQESGGEKAAGSGRVAVVHCKAGKGRSGTVSCSYLISEAGWTAEEALARFTERRMRPNFGAGVSIPSQLRWISYVDRWTRHGKKYVDCAVEIIELQVWGLRNGVKVNIEGFVDQGRTIRPFHTFPRHERLVVTSGAPAGEGIGQAIWDIAGYPATSAVEPAPEAANLADAANAPQKQPPHPPPPPSPPPPLPDRPGTEPAAQQLRTREKLIRKGTDLIQRGPKSSENNGPPPSTARVEPSEEPDPGGMAVIFRSQEPIRLPTADVNVSVERRNKTSKSIGLTMVTAVAHVWFNAFFEGQGPEQDGRPSESGVFTVDWEAMDGIKGSSRKGARALDRLAVVWRLAVTPSSSSSPSSPPPSSSSSYPPNGKVGGRGEDIPVPAVGQPVPQLKAAAECEPMVVVAEPDLGFRKQSPASADVSRASSYRSDVEVKDAAAAAATTVGGTNDDDAASMRGVRCSDPSGEDLLLPEGGG